MNLRRKLLNISTNITAVQKVLKMHRDCCVLWRFYLNRLNKSTLLNKLKI